MGWKSLIPFNLVKIDLTRSNLSSLLYLD